MSWTIVERKSVLSLFGTILLGFSLLAATRTQAEILFEGYSTIQAGGSAIGYVVQRYEFDAKKKEFTSTYFLKTNDVGNNITESLKAKANDKFQPISYQYTTTFDEAKPDGTKERKTKVIDAKFVGGKIKATVNEGGKSRSVDQKLPPGTFLATFLGYLMLQKGISLNKNFVYSAVAEEDAQAFSGEALIKQQEDFAGQKAFRIANRFKGSDFIAWMSAKGEILGTTSPLNNIRTELKASPAEATTGFVLPSETLKLLFGDVPLGKKNALAAASSSPPSVPAPAGNKNAPAADAGAAVPQPAKPNAPQVAAPTPPSVPVTPPPSSPDTSSGVKGP